MKIFNFGLIGKITILVGVIELVAFSIFGYTYAEKYASDLEKNLKNKISTINKMIANEQIPVSSLTHQSYMNKMIGYEYLNGFAVGNNGFVIVSSDSKYLGQNIKSLSTFKKEWLFETFSEKFIFNNSQLTSIAYLPNSSGTPLYRTVINVSIDKLIQEKNKILFVSIIATIFFILLSSGAIIIFAKRLITQRIDDSLMVVKSVEHGDLSSQIKVSAFDELGMLQHGINSMIQTVDKQTTDLSKNIAFLKSHQLAMDESSIVSKGDLKGNIIYANDNFCKITGFTKEEILGKPHNILRHNDTKKEVFKDLWETIKSKKVWKGVLKNKGKLGDYWVDISILPILDENNNIVEYISIRHDITKMKEQKKTLDNIANTDILTGYGNRYKLTNDIKSSNNPALAILNIDNFAQVNDFLGHEKGDIVIKKLGNLLSSIIENKNCELYHLQGDEYVIFNGNISKESFVDEIETLVKRVKSNKIFLDGEELLINLTTAISFESKENILKSADMALKVAKKENKNILIYSDAISLNTEYENNMKWSKKIKEAIEKDTFIPVFQPIINNINNNWEKYECLVRMEDGDRLISPYFFLDISKKNKHYANITKTMIYKSFEMFKDKNIEFSINLTIEDILDEDIKTYIYTMIEKYKLNSKVVFEIVESESIENFDEISSFIKTIKKYNCKIAIDDFGTGYSNFEYLVKLQADYLKIDGSLIKDIDSSETSQIVVKNLVNFAKDLGMKTIAEFVENESILKKVKELGIDYSQGYYFSAPEKEFSKMEL